MPTLKDILDSPLRSRENNDCAVVATAVVLNITYEDAHTLLRKNGRRTRCGTRVSISRAALESRAKVIEHAIGSPMSFFSHPNRPTAAQYLRKLPKTGRYWLASTTHAFAYVDGELRDNITGGKMRARMHRCFEIVLPDAAVKPAPVSEFAPGEIAALMARLDKLG
ncbi:Uncharacterised protein [uncultured archaeon]|nr:Uncharacterised protein [uncultured archaeon]